MKTATRQSWIHKPQSAHRVVSRLLLGVVVCSMILAINPISRAGIFGEDDAKKADPKGPNPDTPLTLGTFRKLAADQSTTVVNIRTSKTVKPEARRPRNGNDPLEDFFGHDFWRHFYGIPEEAWKMQSLGSGVIIDEEGFILTNNHVVQGMDNIKVSTHDGTEYDAKVVGTDSMSDLALLEAKDMKGIKAAKLGDSDSLQVGDFVMAIGNPFGYGHSVTVGVVSALGRVLYGEGHEYSDLIQTDASINPGNSGGPLFDAAGSLIGITTAIAARVEQSAGIGFAIPVNLAKDLLPQLKDTGHVTRGWLGVYIQDINQELAKSLKLENAEGALVTKIEADSPAAKAGIEREDVIVKVNGKQVKSSRELSRLVAAISVGAKAEITVIRDSKTKNIDVKIGERPQSAEDEEQKPEAGSSEEEQTTKLGITIQSITPELKQTYELNIDSGILISKVDPGSVADEAGLRRGDVILEVNRKKVSTVVEFRKIIKSSAKGDSLVFYIRRGNASLYVAVKLEE